MGRRVRKNDKAETKKQFTAFHFGRRARKEDKPAYGKSVRYLIQDREQSPQAEAFRSLCLRIRNAEPLGQVRVILFAGANPSEGGAMAAINSAMQLAYAGSRVVLVDGDLLAPIIGDVFQLDDVGLTNYVQDEVPVEAILQQSPVPNLKIVASGPLPSTSVTVLSDARLRGLLDSLRTQADYVLIASSPILIRTNSIISDACILASKADGVVLVVDSRKVKPQTAKKVLQLLLGAKANVIGTVLNDVVDL